jgi:hypothetical protein
LAICQQKIFKEKLNGKQNTFTPDTANVSVRDAPCQLQNYIYTIKDYSVTHRISLGIWIDVLKTIDNKQFEKIKKSVEKVFPTSASEQLSFTRALINFFNGREYKDILSHISDENFPVFISITG